MTIILSVIGALAFLAVVAHYAPAAPYAPGHYRNAYRDRDRVLAELRGLRDYREDPRI